MVCAALVHAQSQTTPQPTEGDFVLRDFHFRSGETLPELRLHYATLGTPVRDAHGCIDLRKVKPAELGRMIITKLGKAQRWAYLPPMPDLQLRSYVKDYGSIDPALCQPAPADCGQHLRKSTLLNRGPSTTKTAVAKPFV